MWNASDIIWPFSVELTCFWTWSLNGKRKVNLPLDKVQK